MAAAGRLMEAAALAGLDPRGAAGEFAVFDPLGPVLRWTARRKWLLAMSIAKGKISREAAAAAHGISAEELEEWMALLARGETFRGERSVSP